MHLVIAFMLPRERGIIKVVSTVQQYGRATVTYATVPVAYLENNNTNN